MLLQLTPALEECLSETNLGVQPRRGKVKIKDLLDANGLSLEDAVVELSDLLRSCTDPHLKQRILSDIFTMHGVKNDKAAPDVPSISFVIQGENINLNQILAPQR